MMMNNIIILMTTCILEIILASSTFQYNLILKTVSIVL